MQTRVDIEREAVRRRAAAFAAELIREAESVMLGFALNVPRDEVERLFEPIHAKLETES